MPCPETEAMGQWAQPYMHTAYRDGFLDPYP